MKIWEALDRLDSVASLVREGSFVQPEYSLQPEMVQQQDSAPPTAQEVFNTLAAAGKIGILDEVDPAPLIFFDELEKLDREGQQPQPKPAPKPFVIDWDSLMAGLEEVKF